MLYPRNPPGFPQQGALLTWTVIRKNHSKRKCWARTLQVCSVPGAGLLPQRDKSAHAAAGVVLVPSWLAVDKSVILQKQTLTRIHPAYEIFALNSFQVRKLNVWSVIVLGIVMTMKSDQFICGSSALGQKLTPADFQSMLFFLLNHAALYQMHVWMGILPVLDSVWRRLLLWSNILRETFSFAVELKAEKVRLGQDGIIKSYVHLSAVIQFAFLEGFY